MEISKSIISTIPSSENNTENKKDNEKDNEKYRFYQCRLELNGLLCVPVDGPFAPNILNNSKRLFVNKIIPKWCDTYILKYKFIPDSVKITQQEDLKPHQMT